MGSPSLSVARLALYLSWTFLLMPVQGVGLLLRRRWTRTLPRFYHGVCCRILGLQIRCIGAPVRDGPALFASNHMSYLDISVLGALIPGSFIAKTEVAGWPFFGWLAKLQRTVFVDRRVRSTDRQRDAIGRRLEQGDQLILFPEGTSSDGNRVLPFKSALFAAVDAAGRADHIAVQPVSICYTRLDGLPIGRRYRPLFAWYGDMELAPHLWAVAGLGKVEIVVEFHAATTLAACGSRKVLARYCQDQASAGVAAALFGRGAETKRAAREAAAAPAPPLLAQTALG